jgi:hypothetical protein
VSPPPAPVPPAVTPPAPVPPPAPPVGGGSSGEPGGGGAESGTGGELQGGALTARAIEIALGLPEGSITINTGTGVSGLPTPQQAARNYQFSGYPVQNLITSAFGVGGATGGVPKDEFERQVLGVTPRGALNY